MLLRFPSKFIGWHSYEFAVESKLAGYEARAVQGSSKACRVRMSCKPSKSKGGEVYEVAVYLSCKGIKARHKALVAREFKDRIRSQMQLTSRLVTSRRKALEEEVSIRHEAIEKSKKRKLDQVINPEKYRSTSPSVKRTGASNPFAPELGRSQVSRTSAGSSSMSKLNLNRKPQRG